MAVKLIPDVPWTVRVPELGPLRIRLRQHRWLLWEKFGEGDTLMLGIFNRLIRPGDVVYDIGANIGVYTRVMAQWLGASQVIAFEPMTKNYELLDANIAMGRLQNRVHLCRMALSDADGEEELQIDDMNSGSAVLNSVSGGAASEGRRSFELPPLTERVKIARLDDTIERESLRPPNMMKVDTEGAEVKVLRGARSTLTTHRPRLAIALHGEDKAHDTVALLRELGYIVCGFVAEPDNRTGGSTYRQLSPGDAPILANNNIVASFDPGDVMDEIVPMEASLFSDQPPPP
jgi:FkbM family methyltransferase